MNREYQIRACEQCSRIRPTMKLQDGKKFLCADCRNQPLGILDSILSGDAAPFSKDGER